MTTTGCSLTAVGRTETFVSTGHAAKKLRQHQRNVQRMCASGTIPAHQTPTKRWLVSSKWLAAELAARGAAVIRRRR
jgi:hypothetical protein